MDLNGEERVVLKLILYLGIIIVMVSALLTSWCGCC